MRQLGYKPLTTAEYPEDREGYYITAVYTETDTAIVQSYEYVEIPAEENEFNDGGIE